MRANRALMAAAVGMAPLTAGAQVEWRHYRPTNTGILGDYVQTIYVDGNDRPWIAAYTTFWEEGGMSRMNGDGTWEVLSSFEHPGIGSPRFNDIVEGAGGVLWIGTYSGLLRYDPAAGPSSAHLYTSANAPIPSGRVYNVDLAPDGTIWLAIYDVTGSGGGLARLDPATGQWTAWTTANGLPWGQRWPNWDDVGQVAVVPDQAGGGYTVWFSAAANLGVGTWREGTFRWLGDPQSPPPGRYPLTLPSADPVDDLGNLWIETNQGLALRSPDGTERIVGYPAGLDTEVSVVFALSGGRAALGTYYADVFVWDEVGWNYLGNWGSGNHTYAFAEDSAGALWAGGIGGSAKFENGAWQRHRLTNTGMVGFFTQTIDFDAQGNVYLNGNAGPGVGGFDIFDGERWTCVNDHNYGLGPAWGLPSDDVASLCVRANGRVAIAPAGIQGLVEWDGAGYTYLIPQGYDVLEVDEDSLGRLWAVRYGNDGIFRVTGTQRVAYNAANSPLPAGGIGSVEIDPSGNGFVWIATAFGVAHTDGETWNVYPRELLGLTQFTADQLLSCAAPAADGTVWIGSHSGVYRFNPATGQYTRYHKGNTPALPSDDVQGLHITPDGSVWISTFDDVYPYPGGLTRYDGESFTTYRQGSSPLPHNQIWALNSRTVPGGYELWVGTASEGVAVLTVAGGCAADFDGSGGLTLNDFVAFRNAYAAGEMRADFDRDGALSLNDFVQFRNAYVAGCP